MMCKKVIKCKIVKPTLEKRKALEREYSNLQIYLQTLDDWGVYSANKQQAERFYKKIIWGREYPISIRKDLLHIEKNGNQLSKYWARIRVKSKRNLWVAIKPHQNIPENIELCESKLFPKKGEWWLYITIQKEVKPIHAHNILGIDLGIRWSATVCDLRTGQARFYGKDIREIRGKYFYLRRKINKNFSDIEKRKVNDKLHKISRRIVEWAKETNSMIVVGDLKDVRNGNKGRKFNRKISNMPSFKLKQQILYKANWEGIKVLFVEESYTSKTCHICEQRGIRTNGLFKCSCGCQDNADRNGAINIAKRGLGQCSSSGVVSDQPELMELANSKNPSEAIQLVGW